MAFRYRLFLPDGGEPEPDEFVTACPTWRPGDELLTAPRERWRILDVVPNELEEESPMFHGFFVVEPIAQRDS